MNTCRSPLRVAILLALMVLLARTETGWTQKKKGPAVPINPQAPVLRPAVPLGMPRGTTLELTLTGTNLAGPTGLVTTFPAKVTFPTTANNGKDNAKLVVRLEVPKDAPLGFHTLHLATTRGMSNARLFCIDDLPQVLETSTNHSPAQAQPVPVPSVVVGKADAEQTDYFKITAQAGQRLSFEVLGRRLGSAFDPQLNLYDAHSGHELPAGHSNDAPGLQTDPRLTYTFKQAGEYVVAVRDVSYRGGDDFHYRLRIGDFPCATTPLPLAAKRGTKVLVHFAGPNVEKVAPVEVSVPNDPTLQALQVAPRGPSGLYGWPVSLAVSDLPELLEKTPNNEPAKANRIPVPGAITGRFEHKGEHDYYVFALKKGTRYAIEAHTQELGSPTEVYMVLRDAKGAQLQASNPAAAPRLEFTPPADGDYHLMVEHLHYWGGPDETYRLTVTPVEPGFALTAVVERFNAPPGGTVSIPLQATRKGYTGPIEVSVVGAKGLSGKVTIPAGQSAAPARPKGQPGAPLPPAATLPLAVGADLPVGPLTFRLKGTAKINGREVTEFVSVRPALSQGLANLPVPPPALATQLAFAVTDRTPFFLTVKFDAFATAPGKAAPLTVMVTRAPGFTGEVALTATGLPPNVAAALKPIPANKDEVKAQLDLKPNAPAGLFPITIQGKAKHQNAEFTASAPPAILLIQK
jgi:hypothetical protein